ncbi:hypothetical protein [Microseira wollei]|uniref:hypothetical protein n=1 Tax=Microseira wollei TaxID=467598 RepID=UPI001CFC5327|nr:hypothetical protein [Microseira wollei]
MKPLALLALRTQGKDSKHKSLLRLAWFVCLLALRALRRRGILVGIFTGCTIASKG